MPRIKNKLEMYRRYEDMEFGNQFPCWKTVREMLDSDVPDGCLNIRHKTLGLSGFLYMNLSREEALSIIQEKGFSESNIHLTAGDQRDSKFRTFQGEVQEDEHGWSLHYSCLREPMRPALSKAGKYAHGLQARQLLRHYMDPPSYENLINLFDRFPGHAVEFTCFSRGVGVLGWNTVFWEVRDY